MRIGFSTLGCPQWPTEKILEQAHAWKVDCLEIRFLDGNLVGPDMSSREIDRIAHLLQASPVGAETLATSVKLAHGPGQIRALARYLDIASAWSCRRIRVFMGAMQPGISALDCLRLQLAQLHAALQDADRLALEIALETHDSVAAATETARAVELVGHPRFGVVWDVVHTARVGETPAESWRAISGHAREVQIKDASLSDSMTARPALLDQGNVAWREVMSLTGGSAFDGAYMLEWEKAWYPDLAEPEIAIPHDLDKLRLALKA